MCWRVLQQPDRARLSSCCWHEPGHRRQASPHLARTKAHHSPYFEGDFILCCRQRSSSSRLRAVCLPGPECLALLSVYQSRLAFMANEHRNTPAHMGTSAGQCVCLLPPGPLSLPSSGVPSFPPSLRLSPCPCLLSLSPLPPAPPLTVHSTCPRVCSRSGMPWAVSEPCACSCVISLLPGSVALTLSPVLRFTPSLSICLGIHLPA